MDNYYLQLFSEIGVIKRGCFLLSSGRISDTYLQCATIFTDPKLSSKICEDLGTVVKGKFSNIDYIVSPAIGGIIFGYEISRVLGVKNVFCERDRESFILRRGFSLPKNSNILVAEDVVTTGKSSGAVIRYLKQLEVNIVGLCCIVNRSNKDFVEEVEIQSLLDIDISSYEPNALPEKLKNIPVESPGSRYLR